MNKTLFVALVALVSFGVSPAVADSYTANYTGASPGVVGLTINLAGIVPGAGQFGGARFLADGSAPLTVTAMDATSADPFLVVCQDTNANVRCGETGEPRIEGCGSVDITASALPFDPDLDTVVFVYWTSLPGTGCAGAATSGTITLETAL